MTTPAYRATTAALGRYLDIFKAQTILEEYCYEHEVDEKEFETEDVAKLILFVANMREDLSKLPEAKFLSLLNELIRLSNSIHLTGVNS